MRVWVPFLILLLATIGGCVDPYTPTIPASALSSDPDLLWYVEEGGVDKVSSLGPRIQTIEVVHEGDSDEGSYPAQLVLVAIRSLQRLNEDELLSSARTALEDQLASQGVTVRDDTEIQGQRNLANGLETLWIQNYGVSGSSGFFSTSQEVRVYAEATYDSRSNTHVVAVALAQVTGPTLLGGSRADTRSWAQIVGDPQATIDGMDWDQGFVFRLVTHG